MVHPMRPELACVVMGKSGVGKTTLYNKLCETDHAAAYSSKSLTRQLFRSDVLHGGERFTVIDTPGVDSQDEVFKHSFLLKEALTNEPINAIFVMIEFNSRCWSALDEFDKSIDILKPKYRSMVVVIVGKFDKADEGHADEIKDDYRAKFAEEGFPNIMFYSSKDSAALVASTMITFMKPRQKQSLAYEEKEFLQFFRVADETRAQKKLISGLEKEVDDILKSYEDLLPGLVNESDRDEIILSAITSSRYDADQIYLKFNDEFAAHMSDVDSYTSSIQLHKSIEKSHRAFALKAKTFMSYNPDDTSDWRNCIRKCMHCGEVWVKVSGCEGETTCGRVEQAKDSFSRPLSSYVFQWCKDTGRRLFAKGAHTRPASSDTSSAKTEEPSSKESKKAPKQQGCGRNIVWREQPRVSDFEMQKLFDVKSLGDYITNMQVGSGYDGLKKYAATIDTSFST